MQVIDSARVGIAQGSVDLFSDFEEGGEMWTGEGARSRSQWIAFERPFSLPPLVHVSLTLWDMDSAHNVRADISAEKVSETGFEAIFRTWLDTKVARVRMSWIAIGAIDNEDDWDVP
ncbi:H-type lectin domain-containing protein [Marivita hallyeonensis]|uniref:H-type lectin domain-containing protein n=1 Tax=Marivita hallyeonensis TaxID=996342 RepID=A0A1M5TEY2_9RHOB|nr:H-type lectin domain-containing protein [Marivita hallyeonensis]SHH49269.1 H-type lectin domain-containing protein [Marivita hallyeonensis]